MKAAIDQFQINIKQVRHLGGLFNALKTRTTSAVDLTDILRAQLVLVVSVLDHFIHEVVRIGMLEIYEGKRSKTAQYAKFQVSLESASQGIKNPSISNWLDNEIRISHAWRSFQRSDKISEAIRLVSDEKLWDYIANGLNRPSSDIQTQLNLIIDRRNKIVHEADIDPTDKSCRWPIDEDLVNEAVDFIENIALAIYDSLK